MPITCYTPAREPASPTPNVTAQNPEIPAQPFNSASSFLPPHLFFPNSKIR